MQRIKEELELISYVPLLSELQRRRSDFSETVISRHTFELQHLCDILNDFQTNLNNAMLAAAMDLAPAGVGNRQPQGRKRQTRNQPSRGQPEA